MVTASDRGWPVKELSKAERVLVSDTAPNGGLPVVPGFPTYVRPEVAPMFLELIRQLQNLRHRKGLSPLVSAGGYNFRPIRGYETQWAKTRNPRYLSNHSWGLAVDLNAATNPMGRPLRTDWPRPEVDAIARSCGLTFGAEWSRPDPMHFEFLGTPADAKAWREKLTASKPGAPVYRYEDEDMYTVVLPPKETRGCIPVPTLGAALTLPEGSRVFVELHSMSNPTTLREIVLTGPGVAQERRGEQPLLAGAPLVLEMSRGICQVEVTYESDAPIAALVQIVRPSK